METMKLEGLSLIGGGHAQPAGNPQTAAESATGAALEPKYFWATPADVDRAVALAAEAFLEYRTWAPARRAALLRRIAELFEANAPAIIDRANQETALPLARLQGETGRTCGQLRLFATLLEEGSWLDARIDHADPARQPLPKPDVRSLLVPLGPVAVFSSSNFPFAFSVAGGDTASALAAGCPVIVKAHQGHLGVSEQVGLLIQQAVRDCGAPAGLFSLLFGPGREVGLALVKHPAIKAVGFTGSRAGGRALMDAAAARPEPIPVYAEMGSINPVVLLPGTVAQNPEKLAENLAGSVCLGVGQFCTNPGLVLVENNPSTETFLGKLEQVIGAAPAGTMLNENIWTEYHTGLEKFSRLTGVRRVGAAPATGHNRATPTMFVTTAANFLAQAALSTEIFGPCTLVVKCESRAELLTVINRLEGQLTATVHGLPAELSASKDVLIALGARAGRVLVNGFPTGVEVCHAMTHGGPYPATADGRSTSVGTRAIERFVRPLCFQNFPDNCLPEELQEANPRGIWRLVDGKLDKAVRTAAV